MIIDKKGRLLGKISIVDIIIIFVLLMLVIGIYIKFFYNSGAEAGSFDNIEFSVIVKSVRQPTIDAIIEGDKAYEENTDIYLGEIMRKEVMPAKDFIEKTDGTIVLAEKPDKYDVIITFRVPGVENDIGYFADGNKEIKRGSDIKIKTRLISVESKVLDLKKNN
jgi:hypothetical protein